MTTSIIVKSLYSLDMMWVVYWSLYCTRNVTNTYYWRLKTAKAFYFECAPKLRQAKAKPELPEVKPPTPQVRQIKLPHAAWQQAFTVSAAFAARLRKRWLWNLEASSESRRVKFAAGSG